MARIEITSCQTGGLGEVRSMKGKRRWPGFLLVAAAGFLLAKLFGPVWLAELRYDLSAKPLIPASSGFAPTVSLANWPPHGADFAIYIPKIAASAKIIPNVDPANEAEYMDALSRGVAQARGTCFPGNSCRIFLFSHSSGAPFSSIEYNTTFYLLSKLEAGDQIWVYYHGKNFLYLVTDKKIVDSANTEYLTNTGDTEELVLQTCDPPGTTLNRLLVFAKPKRVDYVP